MSSLQNAGSYQSMIGFPKEKTKIILTRTMLGWQQLFFFFFKSGKQFLKSCGFISSLDI